MSSFILCKNKKCLFPLGDKDIDGIITLYTNATIKDDEKKEIRCKHCNEIFFKEKLVKNNE